MPGSLKHKLQQFEVTPPSTAWQNISKRLDEEPVADDIALSLKLENLEIQPPVSAWNAIQTSLSDNAPAAMAVGRSPVLLRRIAVAAALIGALVVGALYFFTGNTDNQVISNVKVNEVITPAPAVPPTAKADTSIAADIAAAEPRRPDNSTRGEVSARSRKAGLTVARNRTPVSQRETPTPVNYEAEYANDIQQAHLTEPQTVAALQPIAVSAPPIRDAKGNIIMDLDVISKPGQQYITVTGPNGNQTRISTKFINCLRYLNGNINSFGRDRDAIECRTMFDEWRNRFLSEGAFIPAADNFFDIFELKEMIQD